MTEEEAEEEQDEENILEVEKEVIAKDVVKEEHFKKKG
jgi:hypothetical protein